MPRTPRSHLPGAVFHLTARTQGHVAWFSRALRPTIASYAAEAISVSDAVLLAYVVMPNHLHLVIQQGNWSLRRIMQPLLRRTALLVQQTHAVEGHVFERRYRDRPCFTPAHVRNAIVYTHLNPLRAGLVQDLESYPWSSWSEYVTGQSTLRCMKGVVRVGIGLRLFATGPEASAEGLHGAYANFESQRIERVEERDPPPIAERHRDAVSLLDNERSWSEDFAPLFGNAEAGSENAPRPQDLHTIARQTLAETGAAISLDVVRSSFKGRVAVRVRRLMIRRMAEAGHRGCAIARYLRVSDQCVSNVLRSGRNGA